MEVQTEESPIEAQNESSHESAGVSNPPQDIPEEVPSQPELNHSARQSSSRTTPVDPARSRSRASSRQGSSVSKATEDDSRPKSSASGTVFEAKKKKKSKGSVDVNAHRVTFTVSISKAIPTVEDDEAPEAMEAKRRKRIVEAPRAQNYFHCEYSLLPEDDEVVKTDVVTFGMAAKIYTERQDPKVLKTWTNGDLTWVAWTHAHSVTVTDDLLKKLFQHKMELRIWDTRDKLSNRAKYDRPKAFKLPTARPGEDADNVGGVKSLVLRQSTNYEDLQPKKSYIDRPLPSQIRPPSEMEVIRAKEYSASKAADRVIDYVEKSNKSPPKPGSPTPTTLVQVPLPKKDGGDHVKSYSRLGKLAGVSTPGEPTPERKSVARSRPQPSATPKSKPRSKAESRPANIPPRTSSGANKTAEAETALPALGADTPAADNLVKSRIGSAGSRPQTPPRQEPARPKKNKKLEAAAQAQAEHIKKHGICSISIPMAKLFAGMETVTERIDKSVNGIEDMFITVSLSGPLMSEEQHRTLNPMVFKVHSATDMPATPMSYQELRLRCQPAYVKYKLFDLPEHHSMGREQDKGIYWDDVNVVLAGGMEMSKLREYLNGPPMEIEIHDRDRIFEKKKLKPTLFGDDLEDEKISNVGTVSSKRTVHNPFTGKDQPWDPYGMSKVDLSGLLLGQQVIHLTVPIHQCPIPDVLGVRDGRQDGKLIGINGAVDGPVESPLPAGHYLQTGASLKVKVEVAYPLVTPEQMAAQAEVQATAECPFARIVYKFDYKNVAYLHKLQGLITEINALALGLSDMPKHVIQAALSTYKLSLQQQSSRDLDIITGFHVLDGTKHLFILEGLKEQAVQQLWSTMPRSENSDVHVLYHSDLSFHERLYGPLDVDLCRIKLHEPLSIITQQPLLYVRDMVPKPCFQALVKLEEMTQTAKLRDAVRNDVFPTADMVISMSREFGIPMTAEDFEELHPQPTKVEISTDRQEYEMPHTSRVWTPIDNQNTAYLTQINDRESAGPVRDYEKQNISMVRERSLMNSIKRSKSMPVTMKVKVDSSPCYNYSSQTLNSTEQGKEKLRQMLAQNPDIRYTYCPDYHHSMTVVPVNVEALKKQQETASHDAWKTPDGWVFPGKKTMIESNVHPRKLHPVRAEDLQMPWEDLSRLPRGQVVSRSRFTWNRREDDLDIWTRPHPLFGKDEPITIHLAGQKLKQEKQEAAEKENNEWRSKVIVNDTRNHFHRCATETELTSSGFKSSNQIDRLTGLLKDKPRKYALKKPGIALMDIPPLNVVLNPSVDTRARDMGQVIEPAIENEFDPKIKGFLPGPYRDQGWNVDRNQVPIRDYEHQVFVDEKGQDFNVYHKERSNLHKRHITPLKDDEYRAQIFRWPSSVNATFNKSYVLPDVDAYKQFMSRNTTLDSGLGSMSRNHTFERSNIVESN